MSRHRLATWARLTACVAVLLASTALAAAKPKRVLLVTSTTGFRHSSIETAQKVLRSLGESDGSFTIADLIDGGPRPRDKAAEAGWLETMRRAMAEKMTATALKEYDAVIFANTTGDLPLPDPQALIDYIHDGHALIGMHSASDTFHGFSPYIETLGGEFLTHGAQVTVECLNQDHRHPATRHFGASFWVHDEIYIFKNFNRPKVHGLLTLDKHPNSGAPGDYPIAWCKRVGKGRVFYTSLGHREDVWENQSYQKHILGAVRWGLGLDRGDAAPQSTRTVLSRAEAREGFQPLFNGVDLSGWKLRNPAGKQSWSAQNGMLVNQLGKDEHGTDLLSEATYRDFTIRYEFMVPKNSNSGLYLRGRHEIQIFDDFGREKPEMGGNGSLYSIAPASKMVSRKPGEWQNAEVTIKGNRITATLNGFKIHDNVEANKATGGELDRNLDQPGPIMLQGDHGAVAFRNVRIKTLP